MDLPPPVPAIEFSLSNTGISKGLAQTKGPQFLARAEVALGHVYLGGYVKNVTSTTSNGEAAVLIGARAKVGGFDIAASAGWKRAIDPVANFDLTALEVSGSVSRPIGRVTPRLSVVWSPDDLGSTRRTVFAEAGAAYRILNSLSVSAAVGRRERAGGPDYTAWNAGLAWIPIKHVTFDVRYYDTDHGDAQPYRSRLVLAGRVRL
jgi:hypothetical protein